MAAPGSIAAQPVTLVAGTTDTTITLDRRRQYTIQHNGVDGSAGDGIATSEAVYYAYDATTVTADDTDGSNKAVLPAGSMHQVPQGTKSLTFKTRTAGVSVTIMPATHTLAR